MMKKIINPSRDVWKSLTVRVTKDDRQIRDRVEKIISRVRNEGDKALRDLSMEIDNVQLDSLEVTPSEFVQAAASLPQELKDAISVAASNIRKFHEAQSFKTLSVETVPGVRCFQKSVPIGRVGLYIPGGTAPLFSTVLMLAIPAKVAGCSSIVLCTPPAKNGKVAPAVLFAAELCGVDRVYKVGGAQAIASMAYGTESIAPVDKIFGPGNRYVMKAKEMVSGRVSIDMPAGPSEVLVLADESTEADYAASDLLSQAEHGPDSQVMLVCPDEKTVDAVSRSVDRQLSLLPRKDVADLALQESRAIVLPDEEDRIAFSNLYAPEHLIISTSNPWSVAERITAAGSVFIGKYSPESAGDYASGTNHTLPTSGWARSCSGVNLDSFTRKITYQEISREGLERLGKVIVAMAEAEGLEAHANAVRVRLPGSFSSR